LIKSTAAIFQKSGRQKHIDSTPINLKVKLQPIQDRPAKWNGATSPTPSPL